jgi:hypothetical protein
VRRQHLDGNGAPEPRVARLVHLAHAARTEAAQDFVWAERGPSADRHGAKSTRCVSPEAHRGTGPA